jgi:NADPH:quinone reductase-like Zn-dependent oxidoreductase
MDDKIYIRLIREVVFMFAVYASHANFDDPLAALVTGDLPEPEVPENWVRVKVAAASLNWHDLWTLRGVGLHSESYPLIMGVDGAGTLDDGSEVIIYPVMGDPDWKWDETLDPKRHVFSEEYPGTFTDYIDVPRRNIIPKPQSLSMVSAAVLGTAWLTAYRMLFTKSGLLPGQTMLIQGASGGMNTALIQLGRAAGMQVWVTGRSKEKRALAERLGAHRTFESGGELPHLVDAVFDNVGEATWKHSMHAVRRGGTIVVSGRTSGANPGADLSRLFVEQISVVGTTMGTLEEMRNLVQFVANTGIKPEIGSVLPMERADEGFRAMWEGKTSGKIVFTR